MKRKPNKPRPEAQTHTEPGGGAGGPGGSTFEAGSEQEPGAAGTSGQSVPKSKFRQKSQQEQAAASKLRMEKWGEKREAAQEKLAKQKPPKQKGPIRKAAGAAGWGVHGFVHGKLYEVEQENVGTEGAHRSELAGEVVLRHGSRFVKRKVREHPARAASRAEARYQKAAADYHFHTAAQEHPELSQNHFTRYWQKQRLIPDWRQNCKPILILTKAPTIMMSTTSIWTRSNTIPMCSFPCCRRSMRGNGRFHRWRAPCKCSLTASIF